MTLPQLRLKKDQERRILAGHLWIYGNEIDTDATPLNNLIPGQLVEIWGGRSRWLGIGYANPRSLICVRLLTRHKGTPIDEAFIRNRIATALRLREQFYSSAHYRLIFGEADGLPGLVVDRYGDVLALQITTAGMEALRVPILAALNTLVRPTAIILRNDIQVRELEGLGQQIELIQGEIPPAVELMENGLSFLTSLQHGQKTGWFYDQAESRARLRRYVSGKKVLDVFSYLGGWGISAAAWGAKEVVCLDSSADALHGVAVNASRNGCKDRVTVMKGEAFELLKQLREANEHFDVVILDPPAFIKRRKDLEQGTTAYERLNRFGLCLLSAGGTLITSSCSSLLPQESLARVTQKAARHNGQALQWLESGQQGLDHPIHPAIAETAYLKTLYLRVLADF